LVYLSDESIGGFEVMKVVTAAIAVRGQRLFVAQRAPGEKYEGFWEFPGGKLEEGESTSQCIERELYEEFGIRAQAIEEIGATDYKLPNGVIRLVAVKVELPDSPLILSVHSQVDWLEVEGLNQIELLPADVQLLKEIEPRLFQ
jgi:8-oxo-dGTP diphosphatase